MQRRAGRALDGSTSFGRAARYVAAGKSVGDEGPGKKPWISIRGKRPGRSVAARLRYTVSTTRERRDHASLIALIKRGQGSVKLV